MKAIVAASILALVLTGAVKTSLAAEVVVTLADQGKTQYTIALAEDAIPAEKTAAEQLQKYLQQITDATFVIKSENEVAANAPQILVGQGKRVRELLPEQDWKALGHDGIVLKTVDGNLILAGGRPRGTLYSVFEFLETLGCRFWTSSEFDIPHRPTLGVESLDVVYTPQFKLRANSTYDINESPEFATILRQYGTYLKQNEDWGGHSIQLRCAFSDLLPVKKYFKDHPEWYTDKNNGDLPCTSESETPHARDGWQMVMTNPEALEEAAKQAIERIRQRPNADSIALWMNDNSYYPKDAKSLAIIEEHGSPSALMLQYVNEMARRIHEVYPDITVEYQAYWWCATPPKNMTPGPGVIVEVAPITADFGHLFDSKWNARSRDQMLHWSEIAPMINTYYYSTNFRWSWFPHPNWFTFGPNYKYWADHNVVGLFDQGGTQTRSKTGDLLELRTWLGAKLMWDPSQDQDKLMDEFLNGYYGAAGPFIKQYIQSVQDSFNTLDRYRLGTYNAGFTFMTLDVVNQGYKLFAQAQEAVKDNPTFTNRLRGARLQLDTIALAKFNYFHHEAQRTGKTFAGPQDLDQAFEELEATTKHFGITGFSEGPVSREEGFAQMRRRLRATPENPLPEFAQGYGPYQVIDYPANDIHRYQGVPNKLVQDPAAPLGEAAMSVGNTGEESIQVRIGPYLPYHKNWRIYLYARVDVTPDSDLEGDAFGSVIIDLGHREAGGHRKFPLKKLAGETYQLLDMGVHDLDGSKEIRFHPMNRPDVTNIYIGRVILIQEGAEKIPQGE